jgi:hypothetical protein
MVWMQLIVLKILGLENPSSRAISRELPHSFRVTAAITAPSLVGVRTVRGQPIHLCRMSQMLHCLPYGEVAPIIERCLRLEDVDKDNVAHIPMQQYQLDY